MDFLRYLAAKKSIDDRSLNKFVWEQLKLALSTQKPDAPVKILELGCGIGTMVERLLEWGLVEKVGYLGIDSQAENIQAAKKRLRDWGSKNNYQVRFKSDQITLSKGSRSWNVCFQESDVTTFQTKSRCYDLLIANAFMDLINVPSILKQFETWLSPGGLFYLTINFDGVTIFEPISDLKREAKLISLFHQSMDERRVNGQHSGDSQTGRHMFTHLWGVRASILSAGASDWVVYPGNNGYPADEAYFLHCILDFFEHTLKGHPDLKQGELQNWLEERHKQIERAELTYIAHQLDFLGTFNKKDYAPPAP
jgi:SAM-dependent methyltransferase